MDISAETRVLRGLGIDFSDAAKASVERDMAGIYERRARAGIDQEEDFYPLILTLLGADRYDESTGEYAPCSDSLFSFDSECDDMATAYEVILRAMSRISGGALRFTGYSSEIDGAVEEAGEGPQEVFFTLNGAACHFTAAYNDDWLDCGIFEYVNSVLEQQACGKRLFFAPDEGQGLIVFFHTAEWADAFEEKTGIRLDTVLA